MSTRHLVFYVRSDYRGGWAGFMGSKIVRRFETLEQAEAWRAAMRRARVGNSTEIQDDIRAGYSSERRPDTR